MPNNEILYGAAYYDEYMPYDRIETDMQMMEDAGMNVIRIAESTWSTWEPQEGVFDFTHLHRMLDCAVKYDMKVIIGTPTYAIPSWLAKKYPDIIAVTHNGQELYGHRQNMDITNPHYLHHAKIIIEKLLKNPEIVCHKPVYTAIAGSDLLTGDGKRILTHHKEESEIVVPQIVVKAIVCRYL